MEDVVVIDGSTQSNIPSPLARDIDNGTLADNISAPTPSFTEVETNFIYIDDVMDLFQCFSSSRTL